MNVFDLLAKISLDTTEYDKGLDLIKSGASTAAKIGAAAVGAATSAITGFGLASVKTGMGFDSSMSQVAATLGKTVAEMQEDVQTVDLSWGTFTGNLREYAQEMGANTVFSATQAADALNYMALAGYDTEKSMKMLPNVLNLAAAGSMDLASASDMITDTQTALGLSMDRTTTLVDEMARAASKTNTSVSQLGSAVLTVGGTAKQLNGGIVELADGTTRAYDGTTELSAALGILADNGTKGSAAGTTLRNVLSSLSSGKFKKSFGELGVSAYDASGQMRSLKDILADMNSVMEGMTDEEKTNLINSTFNARDLKNVNALLATTGDRWDEITVALLDSQGAAEQMADTQLDNLAGDITLFQSALEGAQIAISDKVTPSLRDFVKIGSEGLSNFTKTLKNGDMGSAVASLGESMGSLVGEGLKRVPQMVNVGIELLGGLVRGVGKAISTVNWKTDVMPLIFSFAARIREGAGTLVSSGLDMITKIGEGIEENASYISNSIEILLGYLTGAITDNAPLLYEAATELLTNLVNGISEGLPGFLENTALPMMLQFSETIREKAGELTDLGIELILKLAQGIFDSLPILIEQLPQIIINIAGVINDNAPKLIEGGITLIKMLIKGIVNAVPALLENFPAIFEAIIAVWSALNWIDLGKNVITWIKNGVDALFTKVPDALKDVGNKAIEFFKGVDWKNAGSKVIEFVKNGVEAVPTMIADALKALGNKAVEGFKEIDWFGLGSHVVEGIKNGIEAGIEWVKNAARSLAERAKTAAQNELEIESPSKVFKYFGEMVDRGLALGIDENAERAEKSAKRLAQATLEPFDDFEIPEIGEPETSFIERNGTGANTNDVLMMILEFLRANWPDGEPVPIILDGGGTVGYYDRQMGVRANMRRRGVI